MFFNKYALVTFGGSQNYDGNFDNIKHESYSYLFDLGREPLEPEPYEGSYDKDGNLIFRFGHLIAGDGDILYSLSDNDNSEYRSVYKFNIAERTVDELCRISLSEEYLKSWLDGDKLYLCSSWGQGIILYVDVNDGSVTVLNEAAPKTKRWRYPYRNYIIGAYTSSADELKGTAVYDINGELIQEIPYSAYNTDITISYIIGDYAFGRDTSLDENALDDLPTWYLDLRDIGTDNLMWRKWEP